MREVGYGTISLVLETWDQARFSDKNFEKDFGMVALERLFVIQPRVKAVFGYNESEEKGKSHAEVHARAFGGLLDSVFQMLGPDVEFMEEILVKLGKRHKQMKVNPSFFPFMGQAVIFALEKYLKRELTEDEREAWEDVYEAISNEIVRVILSD